MMVWAVEHCPCVYESSPEVVSLHEKAVDAFQEMRRLRDARREGDTWGALPHIGCFQGGDYGGSKPRGFKGDRCDWWYRIRAIHVKPATECMRGKFGRRKV